jgi:hypothetical protein
MKQKRRLWMFLGVLSGGLAVSKAWDLLSGAIVRDVAAHVALLILFGGATAYCFRALWREMDSQSKPKNR